MTNEANELILSEINDSSVNVELSIANQFCAMPSFKGKLKRISNVEYDGKVYSDYDGTEKEYHHLNLTVNKLVITLKSNDDYIEWDVGPGCSIEGEYKKKN